MFKRLSFLLIVALVAVAGLGTVATAPARAATSLADLMSPDTGLYVELRTADLDGSINKVLDIVRKADIPVPKDIYAEIDAQFTKTLKRDFKITKDLYPLLGDSMAIAAIVPDEALVQRNVTDGMSRLHVVVAFQIKDDAGTTKLLTEIRSLLDALGMKLTSEEKTYNGAAATLYENRLMTISILQAKGLLFIGTPEAVTQVLAGKGGLGADPKFQKTKQSLPENQTLWFWVGGRFYQRQAMQSAALMDALRTPEANQQQMRDLAKNAYKIIDGIGVGLRNNGKNFAVDFAAAINVEEIKNIEQFSELYSAFNLTSKPLSFDLIKQIPDTALGVIYGSNLAQIYTGLKSQLAAIQNLQASMMPGLDTPEAIKGFDEFETGLKENLDIDFQKDVLPWLTDEFAIYGVYNPTSDFAVTSKNQWPFDTVFILKTTDKTKTKEVIGKLESLTGSIGLKPAKVGDGLLSFNFPQSAFRLGVGLVDDKLIVTSGTGILPAAEAIAGKKSLADGAVWKRSIANFPKTAAYAYYIDLVQVSDLIAKLASAEKFHTDEKALLRLLGQFESATIYSTGYADGVTTGSMVITQK